MEWIVCLQFIVDYKWLFSICRLFDLEYKEFWHVQFTWMTFVMSDSNVAVSKYIWTLPLFGTPPLFRRDRRTFDGTTEMWDASRLLDGIEIYDRACDIISVFGRANIRRKNKWRWYEMEETEYILVSYRRIYYCVITWMWYMSRRTCKAMWLELY